MPETQLDPVPQLDANGQVAGMTDPVADIAAYLLSRPAGGWSPVPDAVVQLDATQQQTLEQLTLVHLRDDFSEATAQRLPAGGNSRIRQRLHSAVPNVS